jgi:hypothetical protein
MGVLGENDGEKDGNGYAARYVSVIHIFEMYHGEKAGKRRCEGA